MTGCASSAETTLPKDWSAPVGEARTVYVEPERGDVLLGAGKDITILDGPSGEVVYGEKEKFSLGGFLKEATSVNGVGLGSMEADEFSYAFLNDAGLALVFDYSIEDDIIRAIDLEAGEQVWEHDDYRWSLEKYQAVGAKIASNIAQRFGLGAGAAAGAASQDLLRHRYVQDLVEEVPQTGGTLIKTVGSLRMIDTRTGEERWTLDEVEGSGLEFVRYLPDAGELLLVTNFTSLLEAASGASDVLRIDAETGELLWKTPYGAGTGSQVRDVWTQGGRVLIDFAGGALEAFDTETGEQVLQTRDSGMAMAQRTGGNLIGTRFTTTPLVDDGVVYAAHTTNFKAVGSPDKTIRKFDLETGEEIWTGEAVESMQDVRDLQHAAPGLVVARVTHGGGGTLGSDPRQVLTAWDTDSGDIVWSRQIEDIPEGDGLFRHDGLLYAAGADSLYALDAQTGDVQQQASLGPSEIDGNVALYDLDDAVAVLGRKGLAYYSRDGLTHQETLTLPGRAMHASRYGDRLFIPVSRGMLKGVMRGLHIVDLAGRQSVGTAGVKSDSDDENAAPAGNLRNNYYVAEGGRILYVLNEEGQLVRYRVGT